MNDQPSPVLSPTWALTVTQDRVLRELRRLIGEGPAAFFRDACMLMALAPPVPTTTHLVAHLLREVESGVRGALTPRGFKVPKDQKERAHHVRVAAVLTSLGIDEGHKVAGTWQALASRDGSDGFARRAHRSGLDAPRALDADFTRYFADIVELFDYVMSQCGKRYQLIFNHLDALVATANPTRGDVESLRALPQTLSVVRRFLHTAGAQWIRPLTEDGYFTTPPEVQPDAEGRVMLFDWPGSDYLARMASIEPGLVVDGALTIPETDNSRVNFDILRIALAVPADQALRLAPKIEKSLAGKYGVLIPEQVGALAARLGGEGHADAALSLLTGLLEVLPGPPGEHSTWEINEIVRRDLPALAVSVGPRVLAAFCARLDVYLEEERWTREETGSDHSTAWWPDLDQVAPHAQIDSAAALTAGVLAACTHLLEHDPSSTDAVFAELRRHPWQIYRRIRLHLLARFPQTTTELLTEHLLDQESLHEPRLEREYLHLAETRCTELAIPEQQRVVGLVERGPDLEAWSAKLAAAGREPSPVQLAQYSDIWRHDRLTAFEPILNPAARALHAALLTQYGPARIRPDVPAEMTWSVPAPHSAAELSAMATDEMITLLGEWQPGPDMFLGPDRSAMAGVLKEVVGADRARWSADARAFRSLEPVYITAVLESLAQDRKDAARFDWVSVLDLCEHVNEQATRELSGTQEWTARVWRDARLDSFRLIAQGLNARAIPDPELERVWSMITSGCDDPDPTPQRERVEAHPLLTVLNAVRTEAVGCAIAYGMARRDHPDELAGALQLLAGHLDPAADPSAAVRTVYGLNLPQLISLEPDWFSAHLPHILPTSEQDQPLREAVWDTFLDRAALSGKVLDRLRDQYAFAVAHLDAEPGDERAQARTLRLGVHLLNYYWNGDIDLDDSDGLLRTYYERVPSDACAQLAAALSRGLRGTPAPTPALVERLQEFWEFREEAVATGADPAELAEFGWWFSSGFLDKTWALGRIQRALTLAGSIEGIEGVLERLAQLSETHTLQCLNVLSAWLGTKPSNLHPAARREADIRAIIAVGRNGDSTEQEVAETVIGQFASLGIDMRETRPDDATR